MNVDVSPTRNDDLPEIADITREVHPGFIADRLAERTTHNICNGYCMRDLSLTARVQGAIVGNVYFSEFDVFSLGKELKGVELAIVSVRKSFQRQGVGTALIQNAHEIAKVSGYDVAIVNGWPEYYSRFGYRSALGAPHFHVRPLYSGPDVLLSWRAAGSNDISRLREIWEKGNADLALAMAPPMGMALRRYEEVWVVEDGCAAGARGFVILDAENRNINCFESESRSVSLEMLGHLANQGYANDQGLIDLPVHPKHRFASDLEDCVETATISRKDYLMACDFTGCLSRVFREADEDQNLLGVYWTPRNEWVK
ncbi:GNAT family N-acetyltransferase [Candidatus Hydrogenedentota bacterium]